MRKSLYYLNEADRYDAAGRPDLADVMAALAAAEQEREALSRQATNAPADTEA